MIQFYCKCGQPFSVRPEYAGRTAPCPRCKQMVTVPAHSVPAGAPAGPGMGGGLPPPPPPPPSSGGGLVAQSTAPYERVAAPPPTPTMRAAPGKPARLEVVHGPSDVLGKVFTLTPGRPATVGRDPSVEVSVPSDRVSRRHCRLEPQQGAWMLVDLSSSNGTLVNQVRLQRPQALTGGEYIQTGDCLFRFVVG